MTTRIWTKKETQSTIKKLREAGYIVSKTSLGYQIIDDSGDVWVHQDGKKLFIAMPNNRNYLVTYHKDLMG